MVRSRTTTVKQSEQPKIEEPVVEQPEKVKVIDPDTVTNDETSETSSGSDNVTSGSNDEAVPKKPPAKRTRKKKVVEPAPKPKNEKKTKNVKSQKASKE